MPLLRGPLPVPHGMTTRSGGVSTGAYASLNLGLSVRDDVDAVATNRARLAATLGVPLERIMRLDQVHGTTVRVAGVDPIGSVGDAVIGDEPSWVLAVSAADCLPVLLADLESGAVGAAHAGWRGAVAGVVPAVVDAMRSRYGTRSAALEVWFGAAIRGERYQVGPEVAAAFERAEAPAGSVWPDPSVRDRFRVDVPSLVRAQLERLGVPRGSIHDSGACTAGDPRWYSHRRDRGVTGRHWALVRSPPCRDHGGS